MPQTVDEQRLQGKAFVRNGVEVRPLLEMKNNEPPTVPIPHYEFPRVLYKHPNEPFMEVEHRNDKFELVGTEMVPTEHLTKVVACREHEVTGVARCSECEAALKTALAQGWVKDPYLPKPMPDPKAHLYERKKKADAQ